MFHGGVLLNRDKTALKISVCVIKLSWCTGDMNNKSELTRRLSPRRHPREENVSRSGERDVERINGGLHVQGILFVPDTSTSTMLMPVNESLRRNGVRLVIFTNAGIKICWRSYSRHFPIFVISRRYSFQSFITVNCTPPPSRFTYDSTLLSTCHSRWQIVRKFVQAGSALKIDLRNEIKSTRCSYVCVYVCVCEDGRDGTRKEMCKKVG